MKVFFRFVSVCFLLLVVVAAVNGGIEAETDSGQQQPLPNLWILAVGVNAYDNAGPRLGGLPNLNFCAADAKGIVDVLKAQEGKRYGKVNSILIADGEQISPTAANIRQNFRVLEQAGERDVVILFQEPCFLKYYIGVLYNVGVGAIQINFLLFLLAA